MTEIKDLDDLLGTKNYISTLLTQANKLVQLSNDVNILRKYCERIIFSFPKKTN